MRRLAAEEEQKGVGGYTITKFKDITDLTSPRGIKKNTHNNNKDECLLTKNNKNSTRSCCAVLVDKKLRFEGSYGSYGRGRKTMLKMEEEVENSWWERWGENNVNATSGCWGHTGLCAPTAFCLAAMQDSWLHLSTTTSTIFYQLYIVSQCQIKRGWKYFAGNKHRWQ